MERVTMSMLDPLPTSVVSSSTTDAWADRQVVAKAAREAALSAVSDARAARRPWGCSLTQLAAASGGADVVHGEKFR